MPIDASRIHGELYQGGIPPKGPALANAGFQALVLCASENQPPDWSYPGVEVIRIPMDDIPVRLNPKELRYLKLTAREVAHLLAQGKKVLVTCAAGLNRSGLVTAATLLASSDATPAEAISLIRLRRGAAALNNAAFVHTIATQLRPARRRLA
ncbi:MAG: hypothetical protein EBT03_11050 [Betaproteobacteria bacterium]|nr:hypothetical protein [Betaproteobacteria bacterium]NCA17329.1 hypothetical protein [Betaproteobacteria bacterium]